MFELLKAVKRVNIPKSAKVASCKDAINLIASLKFGSLGDTEGHSVSVEYLDVLMNYTQRKSFRRVFFMTIDLAAAGNSIVHSDPSSRIEKVSRVSSP